MFEGDAAEEKGDDARHGQAIREKVASIGAQCHQTRFNGGVYSEGRVLEDQGHRKTESDAESHGHAEREKKDSCPVKER